MARTPMLTRDRVPEHLRTAFDAETAGSGGVVATGPGSVMINSPEMRRRANSLVNYLRDESTLPKKIQELALAAFRALGLVVYGRVDMLLTEAGEPYVLEVNTIPGMTETSLLPEAAAAAGINYVALCRRIIELSRAREERADQ